MPIILRLLTLQISMEVYGFSSKGFQPKFTLKFIQSPSSQAEPKIQKDYKAEYKKMKAKLALLEASPSTSQTLKTFQPKNKGLVAETFDWDEEEVSDDEEVTEVKVLMALSDAELTIGKNPARNGEWIDISMRKAMLDAVTFQIQNTELTKLYHALQEQLKEEKKINEWLTSSKKASQNVNENLFIPASIDYDQEMVPKSKDWVERLNPDTKLPNFNTRRILVPKSKAINENLKPTKGSTDPESSKDSKTESITSLPPLKNIQGALPSSEVMSLTFQPHSAEERPGLGHNRVIHVRGGVLAESFQSSESSIGVKCNTCRSIVHSTSNHNEFDHFKRETHQGAHLVLGQWMLKEYDWRQELSVKICRATREFCDEKGISHNFSSPYTPEQNGVAERKNRTFIEADRTMLNGLVLSKHF
ncbi:retrovirus-related pol polyprotein from transposon TNT 1-94 [Tanacetum coccineum]